MGKTSKFGGYATANSEQIKKTAKIVLSDLTRKYAIVSAPGGEEKITDTLKNQANRVIAGEKYDPTIISNKFDAIQSGLGIHPVDVMTELERRLHEKDQDAARFSDKIMAYGEEANARIIAQYICEQGFEAEYVDPKEMGLLVTSSYGNAQPLPESYNNIRHALESKTRAIIPGFFGYTREGHIATFSRGGSDLTGAIVAAAMDSEVYENWKDVDGIGMANPKIVKKPKKIDFITYRELRELSYMGFGVFQEEATFPVAAKGIPIHLRNLEKPDTEGTHIVRYRMPRDDEIITGVSCKKGFCIIDLYKDLMNSEIGFLAKAAGIMEGYNLSIEHVASGIDSMSIIFEKKQLKNGTIDNLMHTLERELGAQLSEPSYDNALVCVVGLGMKQKPGVAGRVFGACCRAGINIEMINQGASEINITFGVKESSAEDAVREIYDEFVK
jgi:aspartate kinase